MRSSPVLSVVSAVTGWLALGLSGFAALVGGGKTWIAVFLGAAGLFGLLGIGYALWGMISDRSRAASIFAVVGLTLAVGVLIAGANWGLDEYNR